jgi:hypothetical protein
MIKKNLSRPLLSLAVVLAFASIANATLIAPGGFGIAGAPVTNTWSGPAVADTGAVTVTSGTESVVFQEQVFQDTGAGLCAACLDWVITVSDISGDIGRVTAGNFGSSASVLTDVGFLPGPNVAPATVDRTVNGNGPGTSVIGFNFSTAIPAGGKSAVLVIKTNDMNFVPGTLSAIDGIPVSTAAWGVAPEPKLTYLLSVLAVGIIAIAHRLKKNAVKKTEV